MATAREAVERHAKATVEWKLDVAAGDLVPELAATIQPLVEQLAKLQLTGHEIISETKEGDKVVFKVKYIGKEGSLLVQSKWSLIDGVWKAVEGTVV